MSESAAARPEIRPHRSRGFILGYGAAQAGAFICFIPLLTLLLPQKAEAIGGTDKALLLSQMAVLGGLTAAVANLAFGALSDRTRSRFGRRRPWILAGLVLVALSLALVGAAGDRLHLALAIVAFQLAVNALYAPLTALVPDMVPDAQKGLVSAWAGAALPVANLFTAVVVSRLTGSMETQLAVVVAAAAILILPFALRLREPPPAVPIPLAPLPPARPFLAGLSFAALKDHDFALAFWSRLLAESAVAINTLFLLFWVQDLPEGSTPAGLSATEAFSLLLVASTGAATIAGFLGGVLSDRLRRRRAFVLAGSAGMAAALVLLILWPQWPGPLAAQLLFGGAHGLHATTVAAMTAELLPDPDRAGRDLGVMNVAIALPQSLAPAGAAALLSLGFPLSSVFGAAGLSALAACLILVFLRKVA